MKKHKKKTNKLIDEKTKHTQKNKTLKIQIKSKTKKFLRYERKDIVVLTRGKKGRY